MVGLTSAERRQLDEWAGELAQDNPRLARALAGWWYAVRRRRGTRVSRRDRRTRTLDWLAVILIAVAAPLLIVGAVLAQPLLIGFGSVAIVNGPALFTAARVLWPPAV
jgi:hypothetical protein